MSNYAIRVQGLGKQYTIGAYQGRYKSLRDSLMRSFTEPLRRIGGKNGAGQADRTIWALKDVSFDIEHGEVVGIIGRNGAGKSTLLKLLARITEPTEGEIRMRGRVGSLLEVGTGFHPELTGRENIFLNGAILGMSRAEIGRKFDEIVDFAEIEKFIDTPAKHYSSGMYMRLAFAVAAHLEPEILLVDEVLAVGDAQFQKKCLGKMGDVAKEGRTVLFVSHNMGAIENLCPHSLLLEGGKAGSILDSKEVIAYYLQKVLPDILQNDLLEQRKDRRGSGKIKFTAFRLEDLNGNPITHAYSGMDVVFAFDYCIETVVSLTNIDIGFSISTNHDQMLTILYSSYKNQVFNSISSDGTFRCVVRKIPLCPGEYIIGARITVNDEEADWPQSGVGYIKVEAGDFYSTGKKGFEGSVPLMLDGDWKVDGK